MSKVPLLNKVKVVVCRAALVLALLAAWPAFADDLADAKRAYGAGEFEEAAMLLKPLVKFGNPDAQYLLGRMYEQGDGVTKDLSEARRLFKLASQKGHKDAEQRLALYSNADTGDESVVLNWYLPSAKEGDVEAQYNLGFMYETGWGVRIDEKQAINWYREAADNKHDMAQLRLGMMMITGKGIKQNTDAGVEMLRRSAENGNRVAEVIVQELYDTGEADALNAEKILSGLRRIIDEGETKALKALNASLDSARNKLRSGGVREARNDKDKKAPTDLVASTGNSKSSEQGDGAGRPVFRPQNNNADPEPAPVENTRPRFNPSSDDVNDIVRQNLTLARQGNPDAQFTLGMLYVQGRGLAKDLQEGLRWFRTAANQGNELAKDYLTLWSDDIDAASFGSSIGLIWLKELARDWNADALYQLGFMFESGRGVRTNTNEAKVWYRLAAESGHVEAKKRFDLLRQGRTIIDAPVATTATSMKTSVSTSDRWNWVSMIGTFLGISLLAFAIFYVWRKGIPIPMGGGSARESMSNPLGDTTAVEKALAQDDLEFLKGLWDDNAGSKAPTSSAADAKPERKERPAPKPEMDDEAKPSTSSRPEKPSIPVLDTSKPIISEEEIKLPDLKSAITKTEEIPLVEPSAKRSRVERPQREEPKFDLVDRESEKEPQAPAPTKDRSSPRRFDADSIANTGISRDALASARIDADRLFEDGLVLDKAGRVVAKPADAASQKAPANASSTTKPASIDFESIDINSLRRSRESLAALAGSKPEERKPAQQSESAQPDAKEKTTPAPKTARPEVSDENRSMGEVHFNIAMMFYNGDGVPKNDAMAAKWFKKSAEEGHAESQYLFGDMLMTGRGVPANPNQGMSWIQKAADAGYRPAIERLRKHQAG